MLSSRDAAMGTGEINDRPAKLVRFVHAYRILAFKTASFHGSQRGPVRAAPFVLLERGIAAIVSYPIPEEVWQ